MNDEYDRGEILCLVCFLSYAGAWYGGAKMPMSQPGKRAPSGICWGRAWSETGAACLCPASPPREDGHCSVQDVTGAGLKKGGEGGCVSKTGPRIYVGVGEVYL